ncbi:MAG: hypothetical protein U0360_00955 [Dehalococcoidia bacterium]
MTDRFRDPVVSRVPYERVTPGPAGRLVEVVDYDETTDTLSPPLDLDAPDILISRGVPPSEGDPRFRQQMSYAVAMRVLEAFERGLGRPLAWDGLRRLRLLPAASEITNAYFDPARFSLHFGYFTADDTNPGANLPGQRVYTSLAYDVVAHEVAHPVLTALRPWDFTSTTTFEADPTRGSDLAAIYEGVADLVAILARFAEPEVVERAVRAQGSALAGTDLLRLGQQFGQAADLGSSIRTFPDEPDPHRYQSEEEPHARGALLTSAILQALVTAFEEQSRDLVRLAGDSGEAGHRHPDLVHRLAGDAAALAADLLRATIAALDYLPPIAPRCFDVLRALLLTDSMLFAQSHARLRAHLIEAFHRRGMIPTEAGSLAEGALLLPRWEGPPLRFPHAAEALLHAQTAIEWRRAWQHGSPDLEALRARLLAEQGARRSTWLPDMEAAVRRAGPALGLSSRRPLADVVTIEGAYQVDAASNLVARVIVHATQPEARPRRSRRHAGRRLGRRRPVRDRRATCRRRGVRVTSAPLARGARAHRLAANGVPMTTRRRATPRGRSPAEPGPAVPAGPPRESRSTARTPARRPLRVLPSDPMVDRSGRSVVADLPYERVEPGPAGRLIEVIDYDAVRDCYYAPIDVDSPDVLIGGGLEVSEDDPRFHQQMVYAVAMRVLETFERGLGRPFRWRGRRRLRIYPHAFIGENAYFDEELFALLFGYFTAAAEGQGANLPNQVVFTALSHDIIAHETTHAVLKRLRPHFSNPTNPDVLAFHEGFADIVAILQHFTYPAVVAEHINRSRGDLADRAVNEASPLLELASQFGYARGDNAALRTALTAPDPGAYARADEEHDRGAILVAAVIDGFLRSYQDAIAEYLRIATAGTGVLHPGALHPDLVSRLVRVAERTASRITNICIRAFDYLPPVDITFSDYLRALVTADFDLFPDDERGLRANLIEGFRTRGVYPRGVASLSQRSLRIEPVDPADFAPLPFVQARLLDAAHEFDLRRRAADVPPASEVDSTGLDSDTPDVAGAHPAEWANPEDQRAWARQLHAWADAHRAALGLAEGVPIAVDGFYTGQRLDSDGYLQSQVTVQFTQRTDDGGDLGGIVPMGGATVITDGGGRVRYVISSPARRGRTPRGVARLRRHLSNTAAHRLRGAPTGPRASRRT